MSQFNYKKWLDASEKIRKDLEEPRKPKRRGYDERITFPSFKKSR